MATNTSSASDRLQRFEKNSKNLAAATPAAMQAFWELHKKTTATDALDRRTKELIALAISVVMRCDDCIAHHVSDALRAGASREQIADALAVATLMGGGVGLVYATHAIEAADQLLDQPG
jgi:AhpD family alkylhydroperoxidase